MKAVLVSLLFIMLSVNILGRDGEIWFIIEDNSANNYQVEATRLSLTDPLFGANFMEVDSDIYNYVVCSSSQVSPPYPFDFFRGFDYLRDYGNFPEIGEGKLQFAIYRDDVLVFKFKIDLVHSIGSPDLTFTYHYTTNTLIGQGNGATSQTIQIYNNDFINCWDLLGQARDISRYTNQVTLTNLIAGSVESNIKTTFNSAPMGFPYNNVQLGLQYNPGTIVNLWRGVYYNISASHTSYVKNGINYNFRNWDAFESYASTSSLKVLGSTDKFRSNFYQTQPLTILNNLEGGSTNDNFNIIWQNPDPDITTVWQFGSAYNAFNYSPLNPDIYNIEAPSTFQNLNTT